MTNAEWTAETERLLNSLEHVEYRSAAYFAQREILKAHLADKNNLIDDGDDSNEPGVWEMTKPSPL